MDAAPGAGRLFARGLATSAGREAGLVSSAQERGSERRRRAFPILSS